ncbi:hypothetical protein VSS37_01050 [Candidatus Thiothrix sp. Deng01]|uniref:Uncharacterized protein n=1 Tax=Candidatus Thiothrix phosphatis TaxID=3112415 RepID=A0ABU6CRT8_9GAMM|nr:hypothetical protein [Candidatus Thiothrix sp. Deng01]MEB4589555.1 hypothetical protein [Candidatus Thiothrix sp. Deng01]
MRYPLLEEQRDEVIRRSESMETLGYTQGVELAREDSGSVSAMGDVSPEKEGVVEIEANFAESTDG